MFWSLLFHSFEMNKGKRCGLDAKASIVDVGVHLLFALD